MDETIKQADQRLAEAFRSLGYILSEAGGVIDGTAVYDKQGRYVFAWHRNPRHLLFYLRRPALDIKSTLRQKAISRHGAGNTKENSGRETTIILNSEADAQTLLAWLMPTLPLPG